MERSRQQFLIPVILATALIAPGPASASGGGARTESRRPPVAEHGPVERFRERIEQFDLDDTQRTRIDRILERSRPRLRDMVEEMREERRLLRELSQADTFDESGARDLAERLAQTITGLMVAKARMRHEIGQQLTPAQRERLASARTGNRYRDSHEEREDD